MKNLKQLLSRIIGNENTLSTNVLFIDFTGSHEKAQYLSQLFYWSTRIKRDDGFFAKKYDDWFKEIRVKEQSIRRFTKEFISQGFLETKIRKFNGFPTLHYRLDVEKLINQLLTFCKDDESLTLQSVRNEPYKLSGSLEPYKLSGSINIDYIDLKQRENRARARTREEEKETNLPPFEIAYNFWLQFFSKNIHFIDTVKKESNYSGEIAPILREYCIWLQSKKEWFKLGTNKTEQQIQSQASEIQGMLIRWAKQARRTKEKNGQTYTPPKTVFRAKKGGKQEQAAKLLAKKLSA